MTDNANEAPNDMMMMEFNNDDHWNRIEIDNLHKAAARGIYMFSFIKYPFAHIQIYGLYIPQKENL